MPIRHLHYIEFPLLENSQMWGEAGGLASPVREHYKVTKTVKKKNVELVQILLKRRSLLKKVFTMSKKRKLKP